MIKHHTITRENLSAYFDDELNAAEKSAIEENITRSATMRETLNDYKNIREQAGSIPLLSEDVFFEARLFEKLKSKAQRKSFWAGLRNPAVAFPAICIALIAVFYFTTGTLKTVVNESSNLASTAKNLKPLIFAANLTKEDMFDFAFNKMIPVNKEEKQFLQFGTDKQGQGVIEVKYMDAGTGKLSYKHFIKSLNLTMDQTKQMDDILNKYSEKISEVVLVNDRNVVAVNSMIWNYQNQIRKELIKYAAAANPFVMKNISPKMKLAEEPIFSATDGDAGNFYYCFSADSFFTARLDVNMPEIKKAISAHTNMAVVKGQTAELPRKIQIQIKTSLKSTHLAKTEQKPAAGSMQGNNLRVIIPKTESSKTFMADFSAMNQQLDEAFENMQELYAGSGSGSHLVTVQSGGNIDGIAEKQSKTYIRGRGHNLDSLRARTTPNRQFSTQVQQIDIDSLMQVIRSHTDSLAVRNPAEFNNELKQLKKELMDNINRELHQFMKEQKKEDAKKKQIEVETEKVDPIEI